MNIQQRKTITKAETAKIQLFSAKSIPDLISDTSRSFVGAVSSKNFEKYEVIVEDEQFEGELKLIEWRSKTEFPIVKVLFYKIQQRRLLNECSVVQVAIQNFPATLQTLPRMMFSQILYLLKESLIGFQRLYDRFGPFDVTNRMVLVNKNSKCRVWINENITLNYPAKRTVASEQTFLIKIVRLFEEKCIRSALAFDFFSHLIQIGRLAEAIHYLETFMKNHRIILPNRLNLHNEPIAASKPFLERPSEEFNKKGSFGCSTFKKIPKFILNLRDERKPINNINKSREIVRDLSQVSLFNKSSLTPSKKKEAYSGSRSYISPKTPVPQHLRQLNSDHQQPVPKSKSNVKELPKQYSHKCINHYSTIASSKTANKSTRKEPSFKAEEENEDHSLLPIKYNRIRKHSNQEIDLELEIEFGRLLENSTIKEECSVNSSQQTATTINESLTQVCDSKEEVSIFERNGWTKRVNNLNLGNQLSETMKSQHEGHELLSDDYALSREKLALLGTMGKQVKGSIIDQY